MTATLVVAGDLCAFGKVGAALSVTRSGLLWKEIKPVIDDADFAVVNLESALTERPEPIFKSGPRVWGPPEAARGIRLAGFTTASLANNHILDAGPSGLTRTIQACHEAGLTCVGAGETYAAAATPLALVAGDMKLKVLAFAENEFSTTSGSCPGAWPFDPIDNASQLSIAREQADFVLVLFHGGAEFYPLPSPRMQKSCRFFVDMGADAVICHHSHMVSGLEYYRDRPIAYGLGNLLGIGPFEGAIGPLIGCLARLRVDVHRTTEFEFIPCLQDPEAPSIRLLAGGELNDFLASVEEFSAILGNPDQLKQNWSTLCRKRREDVLASLLCLTRPEAWLLDKGMLPSARWRFTKERLASLRNLLTCETHRECCEQAIGDMMRHARGKRG